MGLCDVDMTVNQVTFDQLQFLLKISHTAFKLDVGTKQIANQEAKHTAVPVLSNDRADVDTNDGEQYFHDDSDLAGYCYVLILERLKQQSDNYS